MKVLAALPILIILSMAASPSYGISSLDKVMVSESGLVNRSGNPIGTNVNINQQVLVSSKITNTQDANQDFIYIVQIKNEYDVVIKIGWITGTLTKFQNFVPAVSWEPTTQGTFTVEIYVWDGLNQQKHKYEALAKMIEFSIIAS